jgi:hypothetical protein
MNSKIKVEPFTSRYTYAVDLTFVLARVAAGWDPWI